MAVSEYLIADCLSNTSSLTVHRQLAQENEISRQSLLLDVKEEDTRAYKDFNEVIDSLVRAKLLFPIGHPEIELEYRSTYLNSSIYDRINEVYDISTKQGLETLAEIFKLLSKKDRITIVELLNENQKGIEKNKLKRLVDTKSSFNHNLDTLEDAGMIKKNDNTIMAGENIEKATVSLEILRSAIIDARQFTQSLKPTVEDVMLDKVLLHGVPEFSLKATIQIAENYLKGISGKCYLLVHTPVNNQPLIFDESYLRRARMAGCNPSDTLEKAIQLVLPPPIWLSLSTPLSDPLIKEIMDHSGIGIVLDSNESYRGIVREEEIRNFLDIYDVEMSQQASQAFQIASPAKSESQTSRVLDMVAARAARTPKEGPSSSLESEFSEYMNSEERIDNTILDFNSVNGYGLETLKHKLRDLDRFLKADEKDIDYGSLAKMASDIATMANINDMLKRTRYELIRKDKHL